MMRVEPISVGLICLESFHFEFAAMLLQPTSLVRVFRGNPLLLLLVRAGLMVVETVNESEGVSNGKQADFVSEVAPEPRFKHSLQTMEFRMG